MAHSKEISRDMRAQAEQLDKAIEALKKQAATLRTLADILDGRQ